MKRIKSFTAKQQIRVPLGITDSLPPLLLLLSATRFSASGLHLFHLLRSLHFLNPHLAALQKSPATRTGTRKSADRTAAEHRNRPSHLFCGQRIVTVDCRLAEPAEMFGWSTEVDGGELTATREFKSSELHLSDSVASSSTYFRLVASESSDSSNS